MSDADGIPRFRGWIRPGPIPPGGIEREDGETLDWISGHWRVFQYERGHRFSVDDVLCAWYASSYAPRVERYLDIGSGIGSVAFTVAWRLPGCRVVTVEAQDISLRLADKSARHNGVADRFTLIHGDLRDETLLDDLSAHHGPFDLVTGSPPYWPVGTALAAQHPQAIPARLEVRGDIGDYARCAVRMLAPGGVFGCVHQASQDLRVRQALDDAGLALLRTRAVRFKEDAPASESGIALYLSARKGAVPRAYAEGRNGKPLVEPDLVLRCRDGRVHPEYATIRLSYGFPPGDADADER